jgi:hypothetical protein
MGIVGIIFSLRNMQLIYTKRKNNTFLPSPPEEQPVSAHIDATDSPINGVRLD